MPWADAFLGPMATQAVRSMRADVAIMSMSAITDGYCFHPTEEPAEIKRAMLRAARTKVLYADHTKFARTALHAVAPVSDFDVVIVDAATPTARVEELAELVPRVVRAGRG